jgi:ribosomal protein L2
MIDVPSVDEDSVLRGLPKKPLVRRRRRQNGRNEKKAKNTSKSKDGNKNHLKPI